MAKICPKCHAHQADDIAFCPVDGTALVTPGEPQADRHQPTLVGVGDGHLAELHAALDRRDHGAEDATQAFDLSALQRPPAAAQPATPPPARTIPPPMTRPNSTSQHKPVPAPPRPASAAVAAPAPAPAAPPTLTLAKLIETSGALPTNLAVARVIDLAELLARGRPTTPLTPAHVAYADTTGSGKPRWAERGALDPGYLAQYQPPDLAQGASPATDVYILGCVLFEALTGKAPFRGKTVEEIGKKQAMAAAPAVRQIKQDCDLPPALEIELQRALKKRPGDRHPSVPAFAEAIRNAVREDDRSTTALDVSETAYLQQLLQGAPAAAAPAVARNVPPAPPVKAVVPPTPARVPPAPPPVVTPPPPPPAPNRTGLIAGLVVAGIVVIGGGAFLALRGGTPAAPAPAPAPPAPPPPAEPDVVSTPDVPPAPDIQPDVPPDIPPAPDVAPDVEKPKAKPPVHKPDVKPEVKPATPETKPPEKKPDPNRPPVF